MDPTSDLDRIAESSPEASEDVAHDGLNSCIFCYSPRSITSKDRMTMTDDGFPAQLDPYSTYCCDQPPITERGVESLELKLTSLFSEISNVVPILQELSRWPHPRCFQTLSDLQSFLECLSQLGRWVQDLQDRLYNLEHELRKILVHTLSFADSIREVHVMLWWVQETEIKVLQRIGRFHKLDQAQSVESIPTGFVGWSEAQRSFLDWVRECLDIDPSERSIAALSTEF